VIFFLGCTRYNSYRLPSVEANDQWWLLCSLIKPFKEKNLERRKCLFHQDNVRPFTCARLQWIPLRIASPSNIFARFSLLSLFPVSKPEEMVRRKEIHYQRAAHRRNRGLFWRVGQIILFGWLEKVGESLDQVYRTERRLFWEIKMNR